MQVYPSMTIMQETLRKHVFLVSKNFSYPVLPTLSIIAGGGVFGKEYHGMLPGFVDPIIAGKTIV